MTGDSVTFYQAGGKIGDTEVVVTSNAPPLPKLSSPLRRYNFNQRSILFLGNKEPNTYLLIRGRIPIFDSENGGHGIVFVGTQEVNAEDYIKILKQSLIDTTALPKYIHTLKTQIKSTLDRKIGY